jgi:hypothetical protein
MLHAATGGDVSGGALRRLWPQKVRTRLTLIYAAPFLVAGLGVFGLAFAVVTSNVPTSPPVSLTITGKAARSVDQACGLDTAPKGAPQALPLKPSPGCEQARAAYYEGTAAGMVTQQNALAKLLGFWALGLGVMTFASGSLGWYISGRLLRP